MKVAIVGAGIAGLAAGLRLKELGVDATILEKSRAVGGRVSTRRLGGYVFDTGAQSIAPADHALGRWMLEKLDTSELVKIEKPIWTHKGLRVAAGDKSRSSGARYTYRSGNNRLAKLLAEGLDVKREVQVDRIEKVGGQFDILGDLYDGVILTMPVPQTSLLLWGMEERFPTAQVRYRSCATIILGYAQALPETSYHALIETDGSHPLQWLSLESVKAPGRAPEGGSALLAQMSASYSLSTWSMPDDRLIESVTSMISRLYGDSWLRPELSDVKRWKYSQPEATADFNTVNSGNRKIVLAGDGLARGRIEYAFDTGSAAADRLLKSL